MHTPFTLSGTGAIASYNAIFHGIFRAAGSGGDSWLGGKCFGCMRIQKYSFSKSPASGELMPFFDRQEPKLTI